MQLPRGIRNNNFGNIEDGPFAQGLPGYSGTDGRFATFASPQHGLNAQSELLKRYGAKGVNSVNGIINRWAPTSDGNDTGAYGGYVAKQLGVSPDDTLDLNDDAQRQKIALHMAEFENGPSAMQAALSGGGDGTNIPENAQATAGTAPPNLGPFQIGGQPTTIAPPVPGSNKQGPDWDKALGGAAASLMAISDPKGAAVLAAMHKDKEKDQWTPTTLPDGRLVRYNHRTGEMQQIGTAPKPKDIYSDESAKKLVDVNATAYGKLGALADDARSQLGNLDEVEKALKTPGVYQGTAAGAVNALRKFGSSALGMDLSGVNEADVATALGGQIALKLRQNMPGSLSDSDREFLKSMAPGTTLTPEANARLISIYRKSAQDQIDHYQAATDHLSGGGNFGPAYNQRINEFSSARRKQRNEETTQSTTNPAASLKAKYGLE